MQEREDLVASLDAEVHRLHEELLGKKICIERQSEELRARQHRIASLEVRTSWRYANIGIDLVCITRSGKDEDSFASSRIVPDGQVCQDL